MSKVTKTIPFDRKQIAGNVQRLIDQGAIFFVSHSGGKDSQALYQFITDLVPHNQIVVIHAHLGEVEWPGVIEHINANISHPLQIARPVYKDGSEKTLLGHVAKRNQDRPESPSWPSSAQRWCTSDFKRGPIHKVIRKFCNELGVDGVNCTGIRAEESKARAKLVEFEPCKLLCTQSRTVWEWRPLINWSTSQVFKCIEDAGQEPHPAYAGGNERLSCMFCILGSENDLRHAARVNPGLAQKYIDLEHSTGYTMFHKKSLESIIASDAK